MTAAAGALFFVERLTRASWRKAVLPRIGAAGAAQVLYIDAHESDLDAIREEAGRARASVAPLEFTAEGIRDAHDMLVWLRIYYEDMAQALELAAQQPELAGALAAEQDVALRTWLRKRCLPGQPFFHPRSLWRGLYLVQVCLDALRARGASVGVLFVLERDWQPVLAAYAARHGALEVVPYGGGAARASAAAFELLRPELRALYWRARKIAQGDLAALRACVPEPGPARVAVQYFGHFNLDDPSLHSDFFFLQRSSLPGERVLALFDLAPDPLDAGRLQALERRGARALALRHDATTLSSRHVQQGVSLLARLGGAARILAGAGRPAAERWLASEREQFAARRAHWRRILEERRIRAFVTWFKYDAEHCALAAALRDCGGALAVYQRSYEGNPTPQGAICADVAFVFSRDGARIEAQSGSTIGCCVTTGYLGDHRIGLARAAAQAIRARLVAGGARFIVAFFDENTFDDARLAPGHERARREYAELLERLLADPSLGLVLKPKTPRTLRRRLGSVAELLDRALATGRCHLYEHGVLQGAVPPAQAALAADVAIHGSVSAATAGMEAALAGVPTLLIDEDGWVISPLNRLGEGRVIFREWGALWDTVARFRSGRDGVPGFGDWSLMLDELDPFRDGRAAERMGNFLNWMLEGFDRGLAREAAIEGAAERYAAEWGRDKIAAVRPA